MKRTFVITLACILFAGCANTTGTRTAHRYAVNDVIRWQQGDSLYATVSQTPVDSTLVEVTHEQYTETTIYPLHIVAVFACI